MKAAATALGGILASIEFPDRVRSAGSRLHEARLNAGIVLAVYVALQLGSVVLGIAISHKPAATSGSVVALEDAPKLPVDITEAF